jgi:hypothetical protein
VKEVPVVKGVVDVKDAGVDVGAGAVAAVAGVADGDVAITLLVVLVARRLRRGRVRDAGRREEP